MRRVDVNNSTVILPMTQDQIYDPLDKGYFVEAAAIADAFIDNTLLYMSALYGERKTRHPSGKPVSGKEHLNFLHQKGDISDALYQHITKFKDDRNVMAHEIHGEYNLLINVETSWWIKYPTQEKVNERVHALARAVVESGISSYTQLQELMINHPKNPSKKEFSKSFFN